jgi:hypothetical protein
MPDLDQIKQGEQGARDRRGRFAKGRSGDHSGRRIGSRNKAMLADAALLASESEALTREVELALVGDPTAMRLCLERILRPCRERTVKFALPPIESASTGPSRSAEGPRYGRGDEGGHLRRWPAARSRRARRRGSRRSSTPLSGRSMPAISTGACRNSKTDPRRALRPALQSRGRTRSTTDR